MELLGKYGVQTTFVFPIVKRAVVDLAATADWTPAAGDTKISKDGGNVANTTNNPAAVGGAGSVLWSLTLTATEMQAARVVVQIVDSATKAVEDQVLIIATYGNASAAYAFDFSASLNAIADAVLSRAISNVEGTASFRSLAGAIAKLVNKVAVATGVLTVYQTDDATPLATQNVTTDANAEPITGVDTV